MKKALLLLLSLLTLCGACLAESASSATIRTVSGSGVIILTDSTDQPLTLLKVYGKTVQNGMPTPENPLDIPHASASETLTITVGRSAADADADSVTLTVPGGLLGIPVQAGGNYTDAAGQQWLCDEVDFTRGVYVQRIGVKTLTGAESVSQGSDTWSASTYRIYCADAIDMNEADTWPGTLCTHAAANWPVNITSGTVGVARAGRFIILNLGEDYSTAEAFQARLAELYAAGTPITALYELHPPSKQPCPPR